MTVPQRSPNVVQPCPVCAAEAGPVDSAEPVYFRCPHCGYVFLDRRSLPDPARERARYELHQNSITDTGYTAMLDGFIDFALAQTPQPPRTALDFGCGPAPVLAELLTRRGIKTDWYDPFFFPNKVYERKTYDLITCTEVLEHLRDPGAVLRLLAGALERGGTLAVMTGFIPQDKPLRDWWYISDFTHIGFFTPESLAVVADKAGLRLLHNDGRKLAVFQPSLDID